MNEHGAHVHACIMPVTY